MAERVYPKAARFIIKKFRPFRKFRHLLLLLLFMFLRHPFAVVLKRSQTIFLIKSNGKRTTTATANGKNGHKRVLFCRLLVDAERLTSPDANAELVWCKISSQILRGTNPVKDLVSVLCPATDGYISEGTSLQHCSLLQQSQQIATRVNKPFSCTCV